MFFGIIIYMYPLDHPEPHFHARYGDFAAVYDLSGNRIEGEMPRKQDRLICAWAEIHAEELAANWAIAEKGEQPYKIDPLR